jgi:hypothetical protein
MNTMASILDKELLQYFIRLDEPQKRSLLEMMKSFLKTGSEPLLPVSIEQYNRELDEAMERISKGDFTRLEELEKEMQSW